MIFMGFRKVFMLAIIAGVAAFIDLSDNQAEVLIALAIAGIGGNAAEHLGGALREAMAARSARGISNCAGGSDGKEKGVQP